MKNAVKVLRSGLLAAGILLLTQACAETSQPGGGAGFYIVSTGLLAVDTAAAAESGMEIFAADGQKLNGVVPLATALVLKSGREQYLTIGESPNALIIFDANEDGEINVSDPLWGAMHLAVDYNEDGAIGEGEYALIGECGVDSLQFDPDGKKIWSLHSDGKVKPVQTP